jgi:UDP-glucose:(heptosyl)LPS alpha-1,3-glucosyltransferase
MADGVLPSAEFRRVPMLARPHPARFLSFFVANAIRRASPAGHRFDVLLSTGPDVLRPDLAVFHSCAASVLESFSKEPGASVKRFAQLRAVSNGLTYRLVTRLEQYVSTKGARVTVGVSGALRNDFIRHYGQAAGRMQVIPNGVDLEEFKPLPADVRAQLRTELGLTSEDRVLIFVGHNWQRKGLEYLVRALESNTLSAIKLLVVGGEAASAYATQVNHRLGGRARFLGTRTEMAPLYAISDACVLPSALESFGLPVLEAMACGTPAVVTRSAGVAELINHGANGLLLDDPSDVAEIARKLTMLFADANALHAMSERARATAERYSWDNIAEEFEAVCRQLAKR